MLTSSEMAYIDEAVLSVHHASESAGWWERGKDDKYVLGTKLALVHSEVSEALEGLRKGHADDHLPQYPCEHVEIADAVIRLFDYAGARNIPLGEIMGAKMTYNAQRADHKAANRQQAGGKAF